MRRLTPSVLRGYRHPRLPGSVGGYGSSSPPRTATPLEAYTRLLIDGRLQPDEGQTVVMHKLQAVHDALSRYSGVYVRPPVWLLRTESGRQLHDFVLRLQIPQGLYVYGGVGCGKTFLMDLFYDHAPPSVHKRKRRTHFHAFMLDVHQRMHAWRKGNRGDPLPDVARSIADESLLLCFDEFQVSDVADALILRRLFENLFGHGCVMVATSNRHPDELYLGGLNQAAFVPFIHLLKKRVAIERVGKDGEPNKDYRRETTLVKDACVYTVVEDADVERLLSRQAFQRLTGGRDVGEACQVAVMMGRVLHVPEAAGGVCLFPFASLCGSALGAADFLALCDRFHSVLLTGVPRMTQQCPEARRLVTLVDVAYERNLMLVLFARAPLPALFTLVHFTVEGDADERTSDQLQEAPSTAGMPRQGGGDKSEEGVSMRVVGEGGSSSGKATTYIGQHVEWSATGRKGVSLAELSGLQDTAFSFARCASRLVEMQSEEYAERWRGLRDTREGPPQQRPGQ